MLNPLCSAAFGRVFEFVMVRYEARRLLPYGLHGVKRGNRQARNEYRIYKGLFVSDKANHGGGERFEEVFTRFTGQILQTAVGTGYALAANFFGNVDDVEYFHGATVLYGAANRKSGITLGNYIGLPGKSDGNELGYGYESRTLLHEYGHYLQSRESNFLYLFKYAIPSAGHADWTERDANGRSAKYFEDVTKGEFNWYVDIEWEYYRRNPTVSRGHNKYVELP